MFTSDLLGETTELRRRIQIQTVSSPEIHHECRSLGHRRTSLPLNVHRLKGSSENHVFSKTLSQNSHETCCRQVPKTDRTVVECCSSYCLCHDRNRRCFLPDAFPDFSRAANGHGSEIKSIDSVHLSKLEVAIVTANLSYLEACFTYPALYTV
jgi:hypothetical protein